MPTAKKEQSIKEIEDKIHRANAVFLADYRGLSVNKIQELKKKVRELQSEFQVTKNTLLTIALKRTGKKLDEKLEGPTATLFSYEDEISPLKVIIEFAKENDNLPKLKLGLLSNDFLNVDQLNQLATLPGRQVLLTQIAGSLQSPINKFVYSLNYHTSLFINVLQKINDKKTN